MISGWSRETTDSVSRDLPEHRARGNQPKKEKFQFRAVSDGWYHQACAQEQCCCLRFTILGTFLHQEFLLSNDFRDNDREIPLRARLWRCLVTRISVKNSA